jgi:hypothetical protein
MAAATRLKKKEVECRERRCLGGEESRGLQEEGIQGVCSPNWYYAGEIVDISFRDYWLLASASVVLPASRKFTLLNDSDEHERGTSDQTMLQSRRKFYNPDQVSNIYMSFVG